MSAKPQFTPRQILDAGVRAESVDQLDHAAQFYRFLLDHHAGAPEAEAALENLRRITDPRMSDAPMKPEPPTNPPGRPSPSGGASSVLAATLNAGRDPRADRSGAFPTFPGPTSPSPLSPGPISPGGRYADDPRPRHQPSPTGPPPEGFGSSYPPDNILPPGYGWSDPRPGPAEPVRITLPHFHLPEPSRRYGFGRFLAGAMIGFGILGVVAGVAGVALVLAGPAVPLPVALPVSLTIGVGAIAGGLGLVFVGQVARALFDTANASRELVDVMRAVADPHADERRRDR